MRIVVFILIVLLSIIIASIYGVLNDQLTYTISPEYYTKFKFIQFGLVDSDNSLIIAPRIKALFVGVLATWWMGLFIGIIFGLVGFVHKRAKQMFCITIKATLIAVVIAFLVALLGLLYGQLFLVDNVQAWWVPKDVIDVDSFILVGSMHNFSYIGGLLGAIGGIYFIRKDRQKM